MQRARRLAWHVVDHDDHRKVLLSFDSLNQLS
jgi:hypothetical protein